VDEPAPQELLRVPSPQPVHALLIPPPDIEEEIVFNDDHLHGVQ
jgi:hypothetical protein